MVFLMEAVRTNVIESDNILTTAIEKNVKCVILLYIDKASYPINSIGMAKAIKRRSTLRSLECLGKQ